MLYFICKVFIHDSGFSETLHSQSLSSWIKVVCLLKFFIELYFLSWLFIKISFLLLCWLFSVVHEHHMQYFRSKIKTKMILRTLTARCVWVFLNKYFFYYCEECIYFPGTVHSSIQQFALHLAPFLAAKVRSDWLEGWFWKLNYQDLF